MSRLALWVLIPVLVLATAAGTFGTTNGPAAEAPFTGVIKNQTRHDLVFPSANSNAALMIPAKSWLEYTVWDSQFDLIGYLKGTPYYCQKVQVKPKSSLFMCKNYDFMVEIVAKEPPVKKAQPVKKRVIKKKKKIPTGGEVEGLG